MSDMLSIGASGVRAYQTALATVGENIANVNATGYTRRAVTLNEVAGGSGSTNGYGAGNGVTLTGVNRSTDVYSSTALRASTSDLTRTTKGAEWLDRIQGALTGNALTSRVTAFFASAQSLAAEPDSTALRTGMLSAAGSTAMAFTATGKAFDQVDADIDTAGNQAAQTLTSLAGSLTKVNEGLSRSQPGSTAAAQLMDQRDNILSQMSELVDIDAKMDPIGRATVSIGGSSGPAFVQGAMTGTVSYARDDNGKVSFSVTLRSTTTRITPNGGTLAGLTDGAERVGAIRQELNAVAGDFVKAVNDNQKGGKDQTGAPGVALFAVDPDGKPTDITVDTAFTSGSQIAAGTGGGSRDASNLGKLEANRISVGYEASLTTLVTGNATAYKQKNTIADAQAAIRDGAATALSTSTGVNLDSEAVDLIRFQQAYAASSRVIQIARETMQTILDIR
ncbi:flagellar hook-associated protein FlgK [Sphingomonas sp. RP10(2022)]|uniref:Flagellar hook-associated protein 1 n=1 Tax=Sphingomonas liriopis TaxID=2949094 RepID=A0A9X2HSN1_9SPHN|nr:flagellar hook-associated protein FlgK [Sphingomonas liriopis]MCP3736478.1 flagellar hook-associated protein FlgK [Sphingomonas liriopis]